MSTDRREFLQRSAAAAVAIGVPQPPSSMPTPQASAFMKAIGLKYPIANAGMGAAATPELAIAVSNAGGLGAIGTGTGSARSPELVRQRVTQTRAGTTRPFAVNYLLAVEPETLPLALELGTPAGARRALDAGADYLICQGTEAGGHVQAADPLYEALPSVIEEAKTVPVLAAGGIANGAHIRRAILAGASGVLVGTRFVATKECSAHDEYKAALARAKAADTVLTVCFQGGWVNAPHRVLRNRTFTMWEAAGCPPPGKRPGEGEVLATNQVTGAKRVRYGASLPYRNDHGAVSAGELVERLWKECLAAA